MIVKFVYFILYYEKKRILQFKLHEHFMRLVWKHQTQLGQRVSYLK